LTAFPVIEDKLEARAMARRSQSGMTSRKLLKLRPVTFRYNNDPTGSLQYGLVAEEVAKVYPELVTYGPDGRPQTVRYSTLSAMLLNELQKQTGELRKLSAQMARQQEATDRRIAESEAHHQRDLRAIQAGFEQRLSALEHSRNGAATVDVARLLAAGCRQSLYRIATALGGEPTPPGIFSGTELRRNV
jgi:hypothetical protein